MAEVTIQQAFELALQYHQAGRLQEAEQIYRQILAQQPNHGDALHHLGIIAHQVGRIDIAVDLIRRAIALNPNWPEAQNNLGNVLKDGGQLDQAIAAYRQAIGGNPNLAEAHYNLGNVLRDSEQPDAAIAAYRRAIALKFNYAEAHCNLGNALRDGGQLDTAIAAYRQAITLRPEYGEALSNLGNALRDAGQFDEAVATHKKVIALRPKYAEPHYNLGNVLRANGQFAEAVAAFGQAIALRPDYAEAHYHLGNALRANGQIEEAIAAYRRTIALKPSHTEAYNNLGSLLAAKGELDLAIEVYRQGIACNPASAEAHYNLGNALRDRGQFDAAIDAYREAIALKPAWPEAHNNLAGALRDKGQLDSAIAAYRQALVLKPNYAEAYHNLGSALTDQGQLSEAIAAYRQALEIDPGNALTDSNLVYTLQFHPDSDGRTIAEELRRWNRQHAQPLGRLVRPHINDRTPDRRLRVGYVSPDLREHVVGRNLLPLILQHDHRQFELTCYSNVRRPDALTAQFQQNADCWRDIVGLTDEQVAQQIRADQIDILVDLSLHLADSRLLIFARKPAAVQVTFAGYPGSTGLTAIDYRLSDPYLDPPERDESMYSEKTVRLPDTFWCYDPLDCRDIPVNRLPALESGIVTFGCLTNFYRINDRVLELWSRVLQKVQSSRLVLLSPRGSHRQGLLDRVARDGIDPARIEFFCHLPRREYMQLYHRIDFVLDTFPYNGHTTSLDSFWMGVPVVTLVGQSAVSRAGWCQLSNLGLTELAAQTPDQFVSIAVALAADLPRLSQLRSTLRQRMERSPLMDAPRFARNIEAAYRQMWRTWCQTVPAG
jgi:predicted O-linked N-acetylglucosamine transferase (SPINDLY family)